MKKIIAILVLFISAKCFSQTDNNFMQKNTFWDSVYFKAIQYSASASIVHLGIDTLITSPTFGKLVRKTAGGGDLQATTDLGSVTTHDITAPSISHASSKYTLGTSGGTAGRLTLANAGDFNIEILPVGSSTGNTLYLPGGTTDTIARLKDIRTIGQVKSKGVFVASPTSADTIDVWQTPVAITITSLKAILRGTSPSVTYNIAFGTNIQSPTAVFTSDITCTSVTTECSNSSGFNDATIPAGSFIWIYTTAASGTIRSIAFTINYTED